MLTITTWLLVDVLNTSNHILFSFLEAIIKGTCLDYGYLSYDTMTNISE
jgi:hypothetical protein